MVEAKKKIESQAAEELLDWVAAIDVFRCDPAGKAHQARH